MVAEEKGQEKDDNPAEAPGGDCPNCGGSLDASGECPQCDPVSGSGDNPGKGNPGNPGKGNPGKGDPGNPGTTKAEAVGSEAKESVEGLLKAINLSMAMAKILSDAGFKTLDDLKKASVEDLEALEGIDEKTARAIQENASGAGGKAKPKKKSDDALKKWLTGESEDNGLTVWLGGDLTTKKGGGTAAAPATADDPTMNALKKWLTGEEDALGEWLGDEGDEAPVGGIGGPPSEELLQMEGLLSAREEELKKAESDFEKTRIETEKLKETMARELEKIQTGDFDPMRLIEESAEISRDLQTEIKRRKDLEEDIEHIKKGTSAVVKYLKSHLLKGGGGAVAKKKLAEADLRAKKLEVALQATKTQVETLSSELEKKIDDAPPDIKEIKQKELALVEKEAEVKAKEDELDALEQALKSGDITVGDGREFSEEELHSRMAEELRQKENEFLKAEDELKKKIIMLEDEIQKHKIEEKQREESARLRQMDSPEIESELLAKEKELQSKEKSILIREDEIQRLKEELNFKEDELTNLKEPLGYKEEEMLRREEDLLYREKLLVQEKRKMEKAKKQGFGVEEQDMKDRLESLKTEIHRKEDEVRAKEKYLKAKMEELRLREQGLIEEEIEAREEERALELQQDKVKTGTPRLDDLLLGGVPFDSNLQIYGPPFVGKEVIVNAFIAEGLKKGIPAIWVITEKTPADIREEMRFVVSGYEEYEKLGLVHYVDAYSKSMEAEEEDQYVTYVEDPTDHQGIMKAVNSVAKEFKKKHEYYRLAFRSVSTLIAYLDVQTAFKFLQSFAGRRKRDKAVSLYMVEKGMHQDQEIQMMGSMMDGMIDLKVEQLKSYLSIQGVCDVQSRAWIKYTYSKHGVSIGSFSLDHIR
ncbi:MAG: ATPase domain-containing protein [Thermoplasmata archaeon]